MYRMSCSIDRNWIGIDWGSKLDVRPYSGGKMEIEWETPHWCAPDYGHTDWWLFANRNIPRNMKFTLWTLCSFHSPTIVHWKMAHNFCRRHKFQRQMLHTISGRILFASSCFSSSFSSFSSYPLCRIALWASQCSSNIVRVHLSIKQQNQIIKELFLFGKGAAASVSSLLVFPERKTEMQRFYLNNFWIQFV